MIANLSLLTLLALEFDLCVFATELVEFVLHIQVPGDQYQPKDSF